MICKTCGQKAEPNGVYYGERSWYCVHCQRTWEDSGIIDWQGLNESDFEDVESIYENL